MFYGLDPQKLGVINHTIGIIRSLYTRVFHGDNMIALDRVMGFSEDPRFIQAMSLCAENDQERSLSWRLHTLSWAGHHCLNLSGDFVECGVYKGFCSHFLVEYLQFKEQNKKLYLYDTYEGIPEEHSAESPLPAGSYALDNLYESVVERFSGYRNVSVVKGTVPDVLGDICPDKVAYLHLDMNSASAETGALEVLFERVEPGGIIILDDYGWYAYRAQKEAEDKFFLKYGYRVLELPTGQGMVFKRP